MNLAARKPSAKRLARNAGSTSARKRPRKALEEDEEEEADWDGEESEEEEAFASESDEADSDDDDGARGVAETPARMAALRPGTGALVRAPAAFKRLRRASGASPLPQPAPPHTTPSIAAPPRAQTPAAPPRWRLKETKRLITEVRLALVRARSALPRSADTRHRRCAAIAARASGGDAAPLRVSHPGAEPGAHALRLGQEAERGEAAAPAVSAALRVYTLHMHLRRPVAAGKGQRRAVSVSSLAAYL